MFATTVIFLDKTARYIDTISFYFPFCFFIKLISDYIFYAKCLAAGLLVNHSSYFTNQWQFLWNTSAPDFPLPVEIHAKQLFLIKIEIIHCFRYYFKRSSRVCPKSTHQLSLSCSLSPSLSLSSLNLSINLCIPVVILTACILFEVIVFLRKLLRKNNKIGGQVLAFLLSYASTQFFQSSVILKADPEREREREREKEKETEY